MMQALGDWSHIGSLVYHQTLRFYRRLKKQGMRIPFAEAAQIAEWLIAESGDEYGAVQVRQMGMKFPECTAFMFRWNRRRIPAATGEDAATV